MSTTGLFLLLAASAATSWATAHPHLSVAVDGATGDYAFHVDGVAWYRSPTASFVCVGGEQVRLSYEGTSTVSGSDAFGAWTGTTVSLASARSQAVAVRHTFKHYLSKPHLVVATTSLPHGLDTSRCGSNTHLSTHFPAVNTSAGLAPSLHTLSWRGIAVATTAAAKGLHALGASGLDCGPIVSTEPSTGKTLVWSTLDAHKIIPQLTEGEVYSMGLSGAIPSIPPGFNYSVMLSASCCGTTAGVYSWGALIRGFHRTRRLPSVTLTNIGYYTDDGAYYYVWDNFGIPARPWPAEEGLVLVKEALHQMGVPVAYMQLDDWWYTGPFYFGNVKAVVDWNASNSSKLFPSGLRAFADRLNLPLQLYTPFWSDKYPTKYNMTESTAFKGTKLVTPRDSHRFFADLYDQGSAMTNGRFNTYEIDFLLRNFAGSASMMEHVDAAHQWYAGLADPAYERNITVQFCLPSATDMLESLFFPAVVQARASGDYVNVVDNAAALGGSSLLMGAVDVAPSKDTLWTASPQPSTSSDTKHSGYTSQPHVQLDAVLATLSLGPVGISDCLNHTDAGLIRQAFRSSADGTLLRPSRPLSSVDAVFANRSLGLSTADVRSTSSSIRSGLADAVSTSHYVVAWRTKQDVTLQATDLYPAPRQGARLAVRRHVVKPIGDPQLAGCEASKPASTCVHVLPPGQMPVIPATGTQLADFSLTVVYEPLVNGAYFLGELERFVHVSPQRFEHVRVEGKGPCGITVGVKGSPGERLRLAAIEPKGLVHVSSVTLPSNGFLDVVIGEPESRARWI